MTTVHQVNNKYIVFTKGGIDELLSICSSYILNGEQMTDYKIIEIELTK